MINLDYTGQVVLVTGATSGIGKKIAENLSSCGAELLLTGIEHSLIDELNKKFSQCKHPRRRYYHVDFMDPESLGGFLDKISKLDRIDVCVNNAGINRLNPIDQILDKDLEDLFAVNLEAPLRISRTVSRIMKKNRYGRIINVASIFGKISKEKRALYSITKFGLRGLTVSSSIDLAPFNVLVNSVSPGFVNTELTDLILSAEDKRELMRMIPMRKFAETEDISKVILFLASRLNTYITGQNIIIDGGFTNV